MTNWALDIITISQNLDSPRDDDVFVLISILVFIFISSLMSLSSLYNSNKSDAVAENRESRCISICKYGDKGQ
jgi:F420-0:gamma-glutamyl ligase